MNRTTAIACVVIALFYVGTVRAGSNTGKRQLVLSYDLQTGALSDESLGALEKTTIPFCVKNGSFITLQVINANPFLYDISISGKVLKFNEETPIFLNNKIIPTPVPQPASEPTQKDIVKQTADTAKEQVHTQKTQFKRLMRASQESLPTNTVNKFSPSAIQAIPRNIEQLYEPMSLAVTLAEYLYDNVHIENTMYAIAHIDNANKEILEQHASKAGSAFLSAASTLLPQQGNRCTSDISSCAEQIETLLTSTCSQLEFSRSALNSSVAEQISGLSIKSANKNFLSASTQQFTDKQITLYQQLGSDNGKLYTNVKAICESYARDKDSITAKYRNAAALFREIQTCSFTTVSAPMRADGDALLISLNVKRRLGIEATHQTGHEIDKSDFLALEVSGTRKLDFSEGVMLNGLIDQSYVLDSERHIIHKGAEDVFSASVGVLIHAYHSFRENTTVNVVPSFGVALSQNQQLQYLVGGSIIWGKERRGIVTLGLAGGQVKDLGSGLEEGDIYAGTEGTIPTNYVFKCSWFLGFTFNF